MKSQSSDIYKELLSIDPSDSRSFFDVIADKLRDLLPEDIVELSLHRDTDSDRATLDIIGCLFSSGGERKSQHTIASIVLLDDLSEEALEVAYEIAAAINIPGGNTSYAAAVDADVNGISVFILSRTASCSLQDLGVAAVGLNSKYESELWPDAIGVCNKGLVSFSVFVPGRDKMGSFFLSRGRDQDSSKGAPSIIVQQSVRSSDNGTLAKVASLITARCVIALEDSRIPNHELVSSDFPSHGLVLATYQFNLAGQLKPQIFEQSLASRLPGNRFVIESDNERLGTIRFLPWQDGAVIEMSGGFPIEIFMAFLREVVPSLRSEQLQFFHYDNIGFSYVLPISNEDIIKTLQIFDQRSSNINVHWDNEKYLVEKLSDEGLSSKFVSRLMYGVMALRDGVFFENEQRRRFDQLYEGVYNGLQSVREARDEIEKAWISHKKKFDSGEIVSQRRGAVNVTENIDRTIRRETENLWNAAVRLVKQSSQMFLREYGLETGFLFKKESTFKCRINELRTTDMPLANYLEQTRKWTEPLILFRNEKLEHGHPIQLKVEYDISVEPPCVIQPCVSGVPLTEYAESIFDRCCVYVEDMTAHCIKKKLPPSLTITEIPKEKREDIAAIRFSITVFPAGAPEWNIYYDSSTFEDR